MTARLPSRCAVCSLLLKILQSIPPIVLVAGEYKRLIEYENLGPEALLSIPTPDHYLPMLYVIETRRQSDIITFHIEGVDGGSISMLIVQVG